MERYDFESLMEIYYFERWFNIERYYFENFMKNIIFRVGLT
jgi:hypothetical protein